MSWRRTPLWIALGGAALATTAGYVNAIGYLGLAHRGVSHVTGQVSQMGIDLVARDGSAAVMAATLVIAFVAGATLSGMLIRTAEVSDAVQQRYGFALLIESLLLGVASAMLALGVGTPELLVAMAMGLQNAMASTYAGAIVRTTHVTGVATDLGILLGQSLRGERPEPGRVKLLTLLMGAFVTGGALGAASFDWLGRFSLVPPAVAVALAAIVWTRVARRGR
jgi:uncharacterized membrane protein YoaK (UPF0700 family)